MQGQLDTELSELGRDQAAAVAERWLARSPFADRVLGPAARVRHRSRAWPTTPASRSRLDERLRETHLGQWQGLTHTRGR